MMDDTADENDAFFSPSGALKRVRVEEKRPRYLIAACTLFLLLIFIALIIALAPKGTAKPKHPRSNTNSNFIATVAYNETDEDDSYYATFNFANITGGKDFYLQQLRETSRYCEAASFIGGLSGKNLLIKQADCGDGYNFRNSSSLTEPFKILLLGSAWRDNGVRDLSGCPLGAEGVCPLSPRCSFVQADKEPARGQQFDLSVVFQTQSELKSTSRYRVLYWREAMFTGPPTLQGFDFEMGVHFFAGLPNPYFMETPREYMLKVNGAMMPSKPLVAMDDSVTKKFAMSIISHCGATTQRETYLEEINKLLLLGNRSIDQYGACGKLTLPDKPLGRANSLISTYKFYFALENELQTGYVTEKLLYILALGGPVPVYLGSPQAMPNITTSKSYISISDFESMQALVDYLLYLDANNDKLAEYHAWRENRAFGEEYLDIVSRRIAGPDELLAHVEANPRRFPRMAQCCRLCDETYVKYAKASRTSQEIGKRWTKQEIQKRYFH